MSRGVGIESRPAPLQYDSDTPPFAEAGMPDRPAPSRAASRQDEQPPRLAVLIDADNAQAGAIGGLLAEVARYGVASVRRIYGDFTSNRLQAWKTVLLEHSIQPIQQFAYTRGKNATDSTLIIDAMDLMYTGRFDGFALVSSDSDFTRLAQRLREEGLTVYGFGERKTPDPFVQACDKFIYVEVLQRSADAEAEAEAAAPVSGAAGKRPAAKRGERGKATSRPADSVPAPAKSAALPIPYALIAQAIEDGVDEEGWAHLGEVGTYLAKVRSDFDPRLYGHRKLSTLIKAQPKRFEVQERGAPGSKSVYVRLRGS
jgi:hypothetical protein